MNQLFFQAKNFVSKRSLPKLSNVEDLLPNYEFESYGHWLFGGDSSSLIDVVNGKLLALQGGATVQPVYTDNSVTLSIANGNALISDLIDSSNQSVTLCTVVKCSSTALSILLGNLVPFGSTASSGLGGFASAGKAYLTLKAITGTGGAGIGSLTPAASITQTNNFFIAISVDKATKKGIVYVQQAGTESSNEATYASPSYDTALNKFGICNVAYTGAAGSATYNEAVIFDKALTLDEIKAVASRAKDRMKNRGITF
ncbi:hypothetical protein [Acinetobacter baumannii]|uniref:hypothetical protein n=1 Tax=Acinetobacter baumannii TaxID=470 RepID=UPI00044D111E|nr:hypothetical protein [Acinetobacter baumannii]EXG71794.1 hypothetical protein J753_1465 [Acinetobacter baumannii 24812_10]